MSGGILTERAMGALFQVSGWPDSFEDSAGALMRNLGFAGLGDFRLSQSAKGKGGDAVSFRVAPERILIHLPDEGVFRQAASGLDLSLSPVLELTGSRRIFRTGDSGVLSRLAAVDFEGEEFPVGAFAQAECMGTGMLFHRAESAAYDIYAPRSWGESFRDFAEAAGAGEKA